MKTTQDGESKPELGPPHAGKQITMFIYDIVNMLITEQDIVVMMYNCFQLYCNRTIRV